MLFSGCTLDITNTYLDVRNHIFYVCYRMDKKGGGNHVIYPDIIFCVDGFEERGVCTSMCICVNDVSVYTC